MFSAGWEIPGFCSPSSSLLEDKMNAEFDIHQKGVQAILLVEDSIRYYSSYLPSIYKAIFEQTNELMTEGLNEHRKTLRMRARPKILLAKTYDDAEVLYRKYKSNLLGVISDVTYYRKGKKDKEAGIKLARMIRDEGSKMPILLQSSDEWDYKIMEELEVNFINKYSKTLLVELKHYIKENYGFGDFVFRDPDRDVEIDRANNLHSLQVKISRVDAKSLLYHVSNNHFSRWLKARALFSIAEVFAQKSTHPTSTILKRSEVTLSILLPITAKPKDGALLPATLMSMPYLPALAMASWVAKPVVSPSLTLS
jgi:hypothetical protein